MKLIIPMARRRLKKTSKFNHPSPLMRLLGKPILLRVLDIIKTKKITEAIFIVDQDCPELKKLILKNFKFKTKFVLQKQPKGVAHAIYGAKKYVENEPCLILFADSIITADLKKIKNFKEDAIIWTKQVEDPRNFGVVFTYNGYVTRLIEKPETPISDLALVGLYYFNKSELLFNSIAYLIKNKIITKGAYQLTDALQLMINKGAKIIPEKVETWHDCGTKNKLLETHNELILQQKTSQKQKNNIFINPVFVEKGAKINHSILGPNVSVGKNAKINKSIISNSIICEDALIEENNLTVSFIGKNAKIYGSSKKVNVKEEGVLRDE